MPDTLERLPKPRRYRVPLVFATFILLAIFTGIYLWRGARLSTNAGGHAPPPVEVSAQTVQPETLPQSLEATGSLQAVREVTLAPEVAGRVVAIHFEAGSSVTAGTPLVQLYDAPDRADRAQAVARAQFARLQHERSVGLVPIGAEPKQLLQQREAELTQANAAIQGIDARIAQKAIRAPFAGLIGIRRVNLGQYVNAGDPLATLTALDPLYVNFTVPQQDLSKLRLGGDVTVRTDAYPDRLFPARINAIEPKVGQDTRNISVQATLANPHQILRPGLYVTAGIMQPMRPETILVPTTAVQTSASGDSVFVVRNGKAELLPVITGQRLGDRIVIETGLTPGDSVITSGQLRVQPGAAVRIAQPTVVSSPSP
ncbi:efflux RND transporter periplasmic adaptor subunit [Magnetospirillum fulvum]|uniref:Membrane fusion protein, multidrug efflux system n=1 Tax=Magnetospirillum fulvum TaxID=1082 RepID=A0A1H6J3A4_MAGFU|nr:efflux RND transporter periplasmic adaptor subunit [Magnetospirillum fulvum]SEH56369.1 membrane fusion protein, multidrug efflux system [Magnetospirillum fulvum]